MREERLLEGAKLMKFPDQEVSAHGQHLTSVPLILLSSRQTEQRTVQMWLRTT